LVDGAVSRLIGAMTSRAPTDKRGRARVARILDAAAEILVAENDLEAITTTSVAERSDQSVATVYRYFADRDEIVSVLFDRETKGLDELLIQRFLELDRVTIGGLMETMIECNYDYFRQNRRASAIWFGTRANQEVADRVELRYANIAQWFMNGARKAGLITAETPDFGGELIVWMGDTALRYIFSEQRSEDYEQAVLDEWKAMINFRIESYTTELGRVGVEPLAFIEKAGVLTSPYADEVV
jgi:AcrR family transcriptional regulator